MMKGIIAFIVCLTTLTSSTPINSFAEQTSSSNSTIQQDTEDSISDDILDLSSIIAVAPQNVNHVLAQYKFTTNNGHGFAAERGNNLADLIKGKNTIVVGDNNVKDGADRLIINRDGTTIHIQDKYYADAKTSINACFDEKGVFRYVDGDGNPMLIEVPSDQYAEAVELMKDKIKEGKISGVTDPEEANTLVKKGALSYKQAKNLAKAGTIESLKYDATNGVVSAGYAFGISAVINYTVCRINGEERDVAIKNAALDGLKTGGLVFCSTVIAGQLSKTGLMKAFIPSSEALIKALGNNFAKAMIHSTGEIVVEVGVGTTPQTLTRRAAKVLRANALVTVVTTVVFTTPDAIDMFKGRISKKQFIKNFAVTAVTVVLGTAGGVGGAALGNLIVPGVGTVPGSIFGGLFAGAIGGWAADKISDYITDDDAEEMYDIIQDTFAQLCDDYVINEIEAENIINAFNESLDEDMFKDMYQSDNRTQFAEDTLTPLFEEEINKRETIKVPTEEEMRYELLTQLDDVVFIH